MKKWVRRCLLGLFWAFAILLMMVLAPRDRTLRQKARHIAISDAVIGKCLWVSDHIVIYMRRRSNDTGFELVQIDIDTGKKTPLDALNRKYDKIMQRFERSGPDSVTSQGRISRMAPACSISPDAQWLVFCTWPADMADKNSYCTYIATTMDGTQEVRWASSLKNPSDSIPLWLHEGHQWVDPVYDTERHDLRSIIVRDLDHPAVDRRLLIPASDHSMGVWGIAQQDQMWGWEITRPMPTRAPFEYLTYPASSLDKPFDLLTHSPLTTRSYSIKLPVPSASISSCVLSPDGDRAAFFMMKNRVSGLNRLMHRIVPSVPLQDQPVMEIWASNLDGSDIREIGYNPPTNQSMYLVQWLPGGKQISFQCQDGVYVVPAP